MKFSREAPRLLEDQFSTIRLGLILPHLKDMVFVLHFLSLGLLGQDLKGREIHRVLSWSIGLEWKDPSFVTYHGSCIPWAPCRDKRGAGFQKHGSLEQWQSYCTVLQIMCTMCKMAIILEKAQNEMSEYAWAGILLVIFASCLWPIKMIQWRSCNQKMTKISLAQKLHDDQTSI